MLETPPNLNHHPSFGPEAMKRYGCNLYGDPKYRVVFADSRRHIVQGEWPDGTVGAKWRPRYRQLAGNWILECWLPPSLYHRMSREKWDQMFPMLPYQDCGDYDHCFTFEACTPDNANVDKLVKWIEAGRTGSFQDNLDACKAEYAAETKASDTEISDRVSNLLPAFGSAPMIGHGGGRGTKTMPVLKSANELGLPMGGATQGNPLNGKHKMFGGRRKKAYSVPVKVA